ncbi:hypothetical protein [Oceanisphaera sp. W20_SRM_FM3]|uniref:hypothetical protein n=1 Tax=Oceanisphaera sp. W20_SRM_FM3 TaxID=3240267 RepID=UPI003F99F6DE
MSNYRTREQAEAAAVGGLMGGLIGFTFRVFILSMIYSPFVLAFGYTFYVTQEQFNIHWFVSAIIGLFSAFSLFFIIGFIYAAQQELRNNGNKFWFFLFLLNITLISGLPFLIGISFGLDIIGKSSASLLEQVLAGGFGGLLLALPAYFGVIKNFAVENEQKA